MIDEFTPVPGSKAVRILPDKLQIPDLSCITGVKLPDLIDLNAHAEVIALVREFISEEMGRNPNYFGAFLYGSLSRGQANNGSDIDLLHVVNRSPVNSFPINLRLKTIFEGLYGIAIDDSHYYLDVEALEKGELWQIKETCSLLDKDSIAIVEDQAIVQRVKDMTQYQLKSPYSNYRQGKKPSIERGPHPISFQEDLIRTYLVHYELFK